MMDKSLADKKAIPELTMEQVLIIECALEALPVSALQQKMEDLTNKKPNFEVAERALEELTEMWEGL